MENLNYSRELYQYVKNKIDWSILPPFLASGYESIAKLHHKSVKFILPDGGRVKMEGLTEQNGEKLHLPFETICIEYPITPKKVIGPQHKIVEGKIVIPEPEGTIDATKRLIYATQLEDKFLVTIAYYQPDSPTIKWTVLPVAEINRLNYEDIKTPSYFDVYDYWDELAALYLFLRMLSCENVKVNKVKPSLSDKHNKKRNGFIPYDSYHVLTLNTSVTSECVEGYDHGERRSPREHIRMGHIRVLSSGKRIWVNATVVNKEAPYRVEKDYAVAL